MFAVIWDTYIDGDYTVTVDKFDTVEDVLEFINQFDPPLVSADVPERGSSVLHVYEVKRELYLHPVKVVEEYALRDTPPET